MDIHEHQPDKHAGVSTHREGQHKWFLGAYALSALACAAALLALGKHWLSIPSGTLQLLRHLCLAGLSASVLLFCSKLLERSMRRHSTSKADRYNLIRALRLITAGVITLIFISFLNANWYTAAMSLGLISLILGFALQTPISSLIGWIYMVIRVPFRVGDRIQIGGFNGDVVEIGYLDTTLWEFAGDYLTSDLPSGRLIRFPNSLIFQYQVYNYSWHKFPYIWNEIPFHVAYESDLTFIEATLKSIAKEELGTEIEDKVNTLKDMISRTPIDEVQIKEYPFVNFRINANTWVEVVLVYLVEPKQSAAIRSRLIKRILAELLQQPDKAMFPKTNAR